MTALALAVGLALSGVVAQTDEPPLLFVLTGQSNAGQHGRGGQAVDGAWLYAPQFAGREWRAMPYRGVFGVELSFAAAVREATGRRVLVAKTYSGGTSIIAWDSTAPSPMWRQALAKVGNSGKPAMYGRVMQLERDARAAWGGPVELAGVLYVQVERDSRMEYGAVRYGDNLRNLIAAWRRDWGVGELPVILIDAHTNMNTFGPVVASTVRDVAATTPGVAWVECRDLPTEDGVHFNSQGLTELGRRMAGAWLGLWVQ